MKRKPKPTAIPNIDGGCSVAIIDDTGHKLQWKRLGRCFATRKNVIEILKKHNLTGGWMIHDTGDKEWVDVPK